MNSNFEYISDEDSLVRFCKRLKFEKEIGVDIECENNFHHYGVYISIIQISTKQNNFIIDVLKLKDIRVLIRILEDPEINKIFHNVDFDFRILGTQFNCRPRNVFDTQQAAVFLGKTDLGLGALLSEYFNIEKHKQFQKADWTRRPINNKMLEYAVNDSYYLIRLKHILQEELKKIHKFEWLKEEFRIIELKKWEYPKFTYQSIKGYKSLTDKERGILKELFHAREKIAKRVDRPVHFIMSNKILMELIKHPPRKMVIWKTMRGVHPAVRDNAHKFFYAVQNGEKKQIIIQKVKRLRYTEKQKKQSFRLNILREEIGKKLGLSPHLIISKDQIKELVINQNFNPLKKWQRKILEKSFSFE